MTWTCSVCDHSEPFDPPRRTDDGEPICEECEDERPEADYPITD